MRAQIKPILQAPDGLQNPRETKAFAIGYEAGKWSITSAQIGNNFAHTLPREFGTYLPNIIATLRFGRKSPVYELSGFAPNRWQLTLR